MEVRLWHEFARYVSLIAAKTTEGRSLFAPAFLCEHSRNECPDLQIYNDGVEVGKPKPASGLIRFSINVADNPAGRIARSQA